MRRRTGQGTRPRPSAPVRPAPLRRDDRGTGTRRASNRQARPHARRAVRRGPWTSEPPSRPPPERGPAESRRTPRTRAPAGRPARTTAPTRRTSRRCRGRDHSRRSPQEPQSGRTSGERPKPETERSGRRSCPAGRRRSAATTAARARLSREATREIPPFSEGERRNRRLSRPSRGRPPRTTAAARRPERKRATRSSAGDFLSPRFSDRLLSDAESDVLQRHTHPFSSIKQCTTFSRALHPPEMAVPAYGRRNDSVWEKHHTI